MRADYKRFSIPNISPCGILLLRPRGLRLEASSWDSWAPLVTQYECEDVGWAYLLICDYAVLTKRRMERHDDSWGCILPQF